MPEPFHHGARVEAVSQRLCRERGSEFVKPELRFIEFGTFCAALQAIEEVKFRPASIGREEQSARFVRPGLPFLQGVSEIVGYRNLALFVSLRCPLEIRLVSHANRSRAEINV